MRLNPLRSRTQIAVWLIFILFVVITLDSRGHGGPSAGGGPNGGSTSTGGGAYDERTQPPGKPGPR